MKDDTVYEMCDGHGVIYSIIYRAKEDKAEVLEYFYRSGGEWYTPKNEILMSMIFFEGWEAIDHGRRCDDLERNPTI
jgi:hypothetical protein